MSCETRLKSLSTHTPFCVISKEPLLNKMETCRIAYLEHWPVIGDLSRIAYLERWPVIGGLSFINAIIHLPNRSFSSSARLQ